MTLADALEVERDAAVAAAAALTVTEPTANGIGSDAFALVWSERDGRLYGLNASGPAPQLATIERVLSDPAAKDGKMPVSGWLPVSLNTAPSRIGRQRTSRPWRAAIASMRAEAA